MPEPPFLGSLGVCPPTACTQHRCTSLKLMAVLGAGGLRLCSTLNYPSASPYTGLPQELGAPPGQHHPGQSVVGGVLGSSPTTST